MEDCCFQDYPLNYPVGVVTIYPVVGYTVNMDLTEVYQVKAGEEHVLGRSLGKTPLIINMKNGEHTLLIRKKGRGKKVVNVSQENPTVDIRL